MPEFNQIITLGVALFLLGYWIGIFLLAYHLIRFGIDRHPCYDYGLSYIDNH